MDAEIGAVEAALVETEAEYAMMPFFIRPLVRRGFAKRTGRDFAAWRALLSAARRGDRVDELVAGLALLAEHYRGAPDRARHGNGATAEQLAEIERRSLARAAAAIALRDALS